MAIRNAGGALQVGEWLVNPSLDTVSRGEESQKLEPRTMRLLMCLVDANGDVVSVDRLLTEVWSGVIVGPASVYQAISQLRKIFNDTEQRPTYIATVPRKGYRLVAAVKRPAPPLVAVAGEHIPITSLSGYLETISQLGGPPAAPPATLNAVSDAVSPTALVGEPAVAPAAGLSVPPPVPPTMPVAVPAALHHSGLRIAAVIFAVVMIGAAIGWATFRRTSTADASAMSIVVLPFVDMTNEKTGQSFCDGLSEELSNWLSQIPSLRVVARTSAFAFRSSGQDVREIGKALGTNHILEGSMRRFGDHMRVTVQLVDARNGYHLWSANYDQPMQDTIRMQDDIARSVAQNLQIRLTSATTSKFTARGSENSEAYQLYLQARYQYHQRTREANRQAIDSYHRVIQADPKFALAYVGLVYALLNQQFLENRSLGDIAVEAEGLIATALRIDSRLPDIYAARGTLRSDQNRIKEAQDDLSMAISLNSNDSIAFEELGRLSLRQGQPRNALLSLNRAAALDPMDFRLQAWLCTAFEDLGRYDEALNVCQRAHEWQPDNVEVLNKLAWLAWSRGSMGDALRWNREALKRAPEVFDYYWTRGELYWTLGLARRARSVLEQGLAVTKDTETAEVALGSVAYLEGGEDALRLHLQKSRLDDSQHAVVLEELARLRLLLGESELAVALTNGALDAADRQPELMDTPWSARTGESCQLVIAAAQLQIGQNSDAVARLTRLITMLDRMIIAGVERASVYALRAEAEALLGRADGAMHDLAHAISLGWRRAWWAEREAYFASLRSRQDFRDLMATVNRSNQKLLNDLRVTDSVEEILGDDK